MLGHIAFLWALMLVLGTDAAFARTPYNIHDPNTAEGWAWQYIVRNDDGNSADLALRKPPGHPRPCGPLDKELAGAQENDELPPIDQRASSLHPLNKDCHVISAQFLVDVLTDPKLKAQVGRNGFHLLNAQLGPISLSDVKVPFSLSIETSLIEGYLNLSDSDFEKSLSFLGTKITGPIWAIRAKFDSDLILRSATMSSGVFMMGATVGNLDMSGSSVAGNATLDHTQVKGNLILNDKATFGGAVYLGIATIGDVLDMSGSSFGSVDLSGATTGRLAMDDSAFAGPLFLNYATIGRGLAMRGSSFFDDVDLSNVTASGNLDMSGSSFAGDLTINNVQAKGALFLRDNARVNGEVDLTASTVDNLDMENSSFAGNLYLYGAQVKGAVFLRNKATFGGDVDLRNTTVDTDLIMERSSFARNVNLGDAQVKGGLFLSYATVAGISLSGAEIGELNLTRLGWTCPRIGSWSGALQFILTMPPDLTREAPAKTPAATTDSAEPEAKPTHWPLNNTAWREARCDHLAGPRFDLRNAHVKAFQDSSDAWPPVIHLEGFHYDRLGSADGGNENEMHERTPREWTEWIERNPVFSTQPYAQLSSVLLAAGDRSKAQTIQFAGREAERHHEPGWLTWTWLTMLAIVAGYGIGLYTFFVLGWVVFLTGLGAGLLRLSPQARAHAFWWRFGASLHRILPVIELSKDFTDFFDGLSQQPIAPPWKKRVLEVYFAGHAIAGYVLGFFLVAAMGGLTQTG